ncbi:unnamed protein product [Owenia fusiformis]|uniref:Uncharacterized protein n=1 Tax=Owenia fusiformis TaxID=6347 RepID=A0A8J1T539_OWEFU|nr:unnamed protein product [Owenia fusiformis]
MRITVFILLLGICYIRCQDDDDREDPRRAGISEACTPILGCEDLYAQCVEGDGEGAGLVCKCQVGYIEASGKCTNLDQTCARGQSPCSDPMSECDSESNTCKCSEGTTNVNGVCVKDDVTSFDCRRANVGCKEGGQCNMVTGRCDCMDGYDMFDCGLELSLVDNGERVLVNPGTNDTTTAMQYACDDFGGCQNGGKCYTPQGGQPMCYCDCSYFGKTCENTRVMAECSSTSMTIYALPHGNFKGNVYIMGDSETCKLEADELADEDFQGVRMIKYQHRNMKAPRCSVSLKEMQNTPKKGDKTFYQDIIIEYSDKFVSTLDARYRVYCVHSQDKVVGGVVGEKVKVDQDKDLPQGHKADDSYSPLSMEVLDEAGNPVTHKTAVDLGTPLRLKFALDTGSGPGGAVFTKARIEMVCAFDSLDTEKPDTKHIDLVVNSCPDTQSAGVVDIPLLDMQINMKAFKFQGASEMVNILAKVKLCQEQNEKECEPRDCSDVHTGGENSGFGRKRRGLNTSELTVSSSFIVVGLKDEANKLDSSLEKPALTVETGLGSVTPTVGCFQSIGFLVTVGILSFVLLMSLSVVLFLFLRLRTEQRFHSDHMMYQATAYENAAYPGKN